MACEMARRGFRVCYFSLETSPATLTTRIIANRLAVPLAEVKAKMFPSMNLTALQNCTNCRYISALHLAGAWDG